MDREKLFKRKRGLKQNNGKSDEELYQEIDKELELEELKSSFIGLNPEETKRAFSLYQRYIAEHSFESLAEKTMLINLVRDELIKERIAKQIEEEHTTKSANPLQLIEGLRELEDHILNQKEKLGMLKDKNDDSFIKTLEDLKKKALDYYNTHAGETYVKCPNCLQFHRLLMKVDDLEPAKASFFKGTTLYNKKLMELYHNKKLSIEELAEIFEVNSKYITFIYENIYLKELKDDK